MNTDKANKYWFKRRRYGYGWVPTTWQGWASVGAFVAIIAGGVVMIKDTPRGKLTSEVYLYLLAVLAAAVCLVAISHKKGPKPHWQWGKTEKDNPEEDF